jgi:hypothetical protein
VNQSYGALGVSHPEAGAKPAEGPYEIIFDYAAAQIVNAAYSEGFPVCVNESLADV